MDDVLAALAAATEGSRELDAMVYCAANACSRSHWVEDNAPAYTTSVDAALTLVPEDQGVEMSRYWVASKTTDHPVWSACVYWGNGEVIQVLDIASPALALCLAALRARSAP